MPTAAQLTWDEPAEAVVPGHHTPAAFTLGWDEPASDVVPNNHTTAAIRHRVG